MDAPATRAHPAYTVNDTDREAALLTVCRGSRTSEPEAMVLAVEEGKLSDGLNRIT
jgi:hypothetical protein